MSVKDRLGEIETRIACLEMTSRHAKVSRDDIFKRIDLNHDFISRVSSINAELSDDIEELNSDINTLKEALPDVEDKIKYMSHQIEDLQKILCKCNTTPAATSKGMKFIRFQNADNGKRGLFDIAGCYIQYDVGTRSILFNIMESTDQVPVQFTSIDDWERACNSIEWFLYDNSPLLDLTDLVAPKGKPDCENGCPKCGAYWEAVPKNPDYNTHSMRAQCSNPACRFMP